MLIALSILTYLCILFVLLPIVKSDFWIFRSLEYSRFQNFIICVIIVFLWIIYYALFNEIDIFAFCINALCVVYLTVKIIPYSIFGIKEIKRVKKRNANREIKILSANVLQDNTAYNKLLQQISVSNPDIVFLLETDEKWQNAVKSLKENYPHSIEVPKENTYGMLFYSKFKLIDKEINYIVKHDIPSVSCKVILHDESIIQIWGLHPEPPVPGESLTSTAKDKELAIIALKVKQCKLPTIVMGDLNDVAWSNTTSLLTKTSGLLDVRKGRGFYSTFSAHHWYIRFPLDYIFCSADFGFISMKRLKYNGSDHFPIYTHLIYAPKLKKTQKKEAPNKEVITEAKETAGQRIKVE
ncbi:endonuclease/exonuclease/phosphatase family protein [Pedobacter cryophilus]|uniref:Endonuclease/exonuclease/phosphatase family protein n=1 Tax=Pedobacter cryophilus TaxID=2571271 RepID=A0A4U1BYN4_9SPHI|nr:endonuclease/exonuclease/phosphatase family protein [Pedobacter cryophilus]TKB97699.1 endonuclease/exonuclease/phosphatase family protein [Pedobacter cryophilus]